jgi:mono/diheme cytochrome c family protein
MPSHPVPSSFLAFVVFGVIIASIITILGFAIAKSGQKDDRPALAATTAAAIEVIEDTSNAITIDSLDENDPLRDILAADGSADEPAPGGDGGNEPPPGSPPPPPPPVPGEPNATHGQELFFTNGCNICHGDTGGGGIGPEIAGTALSIDEVITQYRTPRGVMPAFAENRVPDADVNDIYAWLQTLPK